MKNEEVKKRRNPLNTRLGGGKRKNRDTRRNKRREEAQARQAERDKRTPEQQLELLNKRGHGHCAEAKRLAV